MENGRKKIAAIGTGTLTGGGSGIEELVNASRRGDLGGDIVCILSNIKEGGVYERAKRLGIRFEYFEAPWTFERFQEIVGEDVDLVCLSGFLRMTVGFDPQKTINIHPGLLPEYGGDDMWGHHVHEAVMKDFHAGRITHSGLSMHFVIDDEYDGGPVFFEKKVLIEEGDTSDSLGARINVLEHKYQWALTDLVLKGKIHWDGVNPESLVVPEGLDTL